MAILLIRCLQKRSTRHKPLAITTSWMHRASLSTLSATLLAAMLLTGCFPLGSKLGREQVVANRSQSNGHVAEEILGVPTEHHWCLLVAPDGPELNYVLSETWRFYLVSPDGERKPLPFLKKRGGNVKPWDLIAPISHTNLWIAEVYTESLNRIEHGHYGFRVICFNSKKIVSEVTLDCPESGDFVFDSENHILTYNMKSGSRKWDSLADTGSH